MPDFGTTISNEPISLAEAKSHLRVDTTDEDSDILAIIRAARVYCENFQNRTYITRTRELWLDAWPDKDRIDIPRPPLQSVTSVKYYGTDNTEYTMPPADYFVDTKNEPGRLVLTYGKSWPTTTLRPANGILITFAAGYGADGTFVPEDVKRAMRLLIGHWYENREAVLTGTKTISKEIEFAVHALLWQDRVVTF